MAHQEYVVTNRKNHTAKAKAAKSAVALAVAALMLGAGAASAALWPRRVEARILALLPTIRLRSMRPGSWETAEYNKNWGLKAMKASSAYALGYYGQGVKVGMMDSGFLTTHPGTFRR